MLLHARRVSRRLLFLVLLLCLPRLAFATGIPFADEFPSAGFDERFSTNWYALVRTVVPPSYTAKGNFDFQKATNALCRESRKKNPAAKALWGTVLITTSHSRETTEAGIRLMSEAATNGYVPAMLNLGYFYESGRYVRLNYTESFRWFKQAADLGVAEAELKLAGCYENGLGAAPDMFTAVKYYQLSAEHTNYTAMKTLGYLLMNGKGVNKDEQAARHWFLRAATEGGNRRAMYNLGALCCQLPSDTNALLAGFKWMKQSAELGDPLAANELSHFYYRGWGGIETNVASYRYWVFKAAFLGSTEAQFMVGRAYRLGDGVPMDRENSKIWYGKAAAKNHPSALYDLALLYLEEKTNRAAVETANALMLRAAQMGHREAQFQCAMSYFRGDVMQDCDSGKAWLAKSALNGWPKAEFTLFQIFYNGLPPSKECPRYPVDKVEAIKWLRLAADHGNWPAQSVLAVMLIRGLDMEKNKTEAENLLRESAGYGFAESQGDLGFAILNGDTSSTDLVEAAMWCKLALTHSKDTNVLQRTTFNLSRINARLTPVQQQDAETRANEFQPLPAPNLDPMIKGWETNPYYKQEDGQLLH